MAVVAVEHLREVEATLVAIGTEKIPKAMRRVTVEGAKVMRREIRAAATGMFVGHGTDKRRVPGGLASTIRYKASRGSGGTRYVVAPFGKGSAHRNVVIGGHEIKGRKRAVFGHTLNHAPRKSMARSGERTTPRPFVRVGFERAEAPARAAIEAAAKLAIEEAAR